MNVTRLAVRAVLGVGAAVVLAAAPSILLSYAAGGWVTKYTNKRRRWRCGSHAPSQAGKVIVVTGATSGIGLITATELARKGARVVVCGRDLAKAAAAVESIKESLAVTGEPALLEPGVADISTLAGAKAGGAALAAQCGGRIDTLVLNAGVHKNFGNSTNGFGLTKDGFEEHHGVNFLNHFALAHELKGCLAAAASAASPSRLVVVSSMAAEAAPEQGVVFGWWRPANGSMPVGYTDGAAYGSAKLATTLYTESLGEELAPRHVWTCSLHPGVISSGLQRGYKGSDHWKDGRTGLALLLRWYRMTLFGLAETTGPYGALTQLFCATAPEALLEPTGSYFVPVGLPGRLKHKRASDAALRARVAKEVKAIVDLGMVREWEP